MPGRQAEEIHMLVAAKMYAEGFLQKEIADRLGLSQSVISRLVKVAMKEEYLETEITFNEKKLTKEKLHQVELEISGELQDLAQTVVQRVKRNSSGPKIQVLPDETYNESAANYLYHLLNQTKSSYVAVSWGRTLEEIIKKTQEKRPIKRD